MSKDEVIKTSKHLVAFIDILGGKHHIKEDNDNENLNKLKILYDNFRNEYDRKNNSDNRYIKINIFSDNILIAAQTHYENTRMVNLTIKRFFESVSNFQTEALIKGFIVRGGIEYGDLYINNNDFVWGTALIESYQLEKSAIYPRIKIGKKTLDLLREIDNKFHNKIFIFKHLPILQENNVKYIDYLKNLKKSQDEDIILSDLSELITEQISECVGKKRDKWIWLAKKFNEYCDINEHEALLIERI